MQALTVSGSETGAGATRALVSISDVWTNSSGNVAPRLLDLEVTDTGITSGTIDYGNTALIRGRRNGTDVFRVDHGGTMNLGSGQCYLDTNAAKIQIAYFWNYSVNGDVWLGRDDSAVWRLGLTHPTTPTAQTLKAHDVATGTGAGLTLAGGRGSVAGGDVVLAVSANSGTAAAALTCTAAGAVVVASGRTFQMGNAAATGLAAGALAATTNASLIIHDSTGQAYRIPCVI